MSAAGPQGSNHVLIETGPLAPGAMEAAASFYERHSGAVARAVASGADSVALAVPAAPYDHSDWRRTAARDLARLHAPTRINLIGGGDRSALEAASSYLAGAKAITGQYLPLEGTGADENDAAQKEQ